MKRETLVLAACECARTALPFTKDPRVLVCIETTERWCRGEATLAEVRKEMTDAAAYADADAAYAAYAAAYAA
ncbi:putative immunity protein, partial [Lactococcus petauri]|uniref:putative immunity protein n=1 Tax=Lactococcus petauri TaxID=1940789 RepID=UPI0021F0FB55